MTSIRAAQNDRGISDPDVIKAARKYIRNYSDHAVTYLVNQCDPVALLKEACRFRGHNHLKVMAQDSDSEDDTESQISRRRTLSSNSRSAVASSSSAILSSSGSGDGPSDILWVIPEAGSNGSKPPKTLMATRLPQSDNLIRADVVRDRLKLKPQRLSSGSVVRYNGGPIQSSGTVSLDWAWSSRELYSEKVQRSTFHVIEDLPGGEVVLRDCDSQDSPSYQNGGMASLHRIIS